MIPTPAATRRRLRRYRIAALASRPARGGTGAAAGRDRGGGRGVVDAMSMVILQPIVMQRPNSQAVYAPPWLGTAKTVTYQEFLERYANGARGIWVSFAADGVSDPELITAYGRGLDCWYIVA